MLLALYLIIGFFVGKFYLGLKLVLCEKYHNFYIKTKEIHDSNDSINTKKEKYKDVVANYVYLLKMYPPTSLPFICFNEYETAACKQLKLEYEIYNNKKEA